MSDAPKKKLKTPEARASYAKVFKPELNDLNGKMEYSIVALFPFGKNDPRLKELKEAAKAAIVKKWGPDKEKWPSNMKSPFRDQGERKKEGKLPDGYVEGNIFMTIKSDTKPGIVDRNVDTITEDSGDFYSGCWFNASVRAYAYDNKGNKGVAFGLGNIQKVRDDDAFGGFAKAEDEFDALDGESSSNDGDDHDLFA